ncbi:MAG: S-methyl-5'-thioadenosine phosphorylase [Candidatus Thermoplasmatota archaeon]|nr:S-methyl-5'-thioadenosine phosphorylase [Candidatus Thermoplasmatota archaeon]
MSLATPPLDGLAPIGIIGGTGVYDASQVSDLRSVKVTTPYGPPSAAIDLGDFQGTPIAFLPRHGKGHTIPPHAVNYRANVWALHDLGVRRIVSPSAVGSLKEEYKPGDFVFPDQFIDQTKNREYTFYDGGATVHVSLADPFCPTLREHFIGHARALELSVHEGGTYMCIEGPRFSTRAESRMFRQFGEIIGMTACPEAQLAREMEICYLGIAMVTDYDVWAEKPVDVPGILRTLAENQSKSQSLLARAVPTIPEERSCICASALEGAEV